MHAEEDKKKRALVEARNHADSAIYSTEKTLRDMGDKVDSKTKQDIEDQISKLKSVMDGNDAEAIQRELDQLMQISHKVAEEAYKRASAQQGGPEGAGPGPGGPGSTAGRQKPDDDVVDADFEEVKDK